MSDHNSFSSGVLTASVMTHPLRATRAESLCSELGPEHAWAAVDPHPQGPPSALRSARVAFAQAAREKEGHHLVLQDDVILSSGFVDAVQDAVTEFPESALSFFLEWGSRTAYLARWAAFTGADAVSVINPYMPTLAMVLPRRIAVELARFLELQGRANEPDDREVLRFLRGAGIPMLVMVPTPSSTTTCPASPVTVTTGRVVRCASRNGHDTGAMSFGPHGFCRSCGGTWPVR